MALTHNRRMDVSRARWVVVACLGLACAEDDDPAATTAATIDPSTTSVGSMTGMTSDPTMAPTSDPDADDDGVDDAPDSSTSGTPTDVPMECMDGEEDCPCIDGDCMRGLMCIADVCVAPAHCDPDPNEPNDIAAEATMLETINDDDLQGDVLEGVLADPSDLDWFTYAGTDIVGETVDPARTVTVEGGTLELCKFLDCLEGTELVECPPGSMAAESAGHPGCCSTTSFGFSPEGFECEAGAFETGAQVYIRLRNADAQCVAYEVAYHY
jgi:hypothetical protein